MRTTLDLPDDVGLVLREESARRGGRGKASLGQLVAEAVREKFGSQRGWRSRKIGRGDGMPVVRRAYVGEVLLQADIDRALDEIS
ncbi:MAG: hypothetical protein ACOYNN_13055 [Terrimicrobiaceae bacterium]|jgi:hypothetical protein